MNLKRLLSYLSAALSIAFVLWKMTGVTSLETDYSSGFSEHAWRTIKPGMSAATVQELLGKPLETSLFTDNTNSRALHFAKHDSAACVIRYVVVNNDGVVTDVVSDIHQLD